MAKYCCKNCGAELYFDPNLGKLHCEYCDSSYDPSEFEYVPENDAGKAAEKDKTIRQDLSEEEIDKAMAAGMTEEQAARLFEPFSKGLDRPGEEKNTGLGLWICRSVIELHQGYIWVNSEPGKGTVFSFALPCEQQKGQE